jgi:hypothetical protein
MAKVLVTALESIYDTEDSAYIINYENDSWNYSSSQNHFYQLFDLVLETIRKYIEKLQVENLSLKKEWNAIKEENE